MKQQFTSAGTSINSKRLPAVFAKLPEAPRVLLDYGCGRYIDHIREALPETEYLPYDIYNQPQKVNMSTVKRLRSLRSARVPVDVVCSNVLNVIAEDNVIEEISRQIVWIIRAGGGTAYITVYEGNRSGEGKQTGPDQYQRNKPLRDYLRFFPGAVIRSGMIIVK